MFFYTSNKIIHKNIIIQRLIELQNAEACLIQAAEWIEKKWGYLRKYPGLKYRIGTLKKQEQNIYIATYAGQPIGVFAILDSSHTLPSLPTKELWFLYVDESFRHLGVGSYMMNEVKKLCGKQGVKRIVFDTLTPTLHRFYQKKGATEVCEGNLLGAPVTIMQILKTPSPRSARTTAARRSAAKTPAAATADSDISNYRPNGQR
jgi:GNAT superfamily N-acetyltransferase